MRARMLAVLSLGLFLAAPLAAQRPLASRPKDQRIPVRGTVVDAMSGTPLPNTMVRLVDANLGVLADSLGRFTFPEVPLGTMTLAVKEYGYDELDTDIEVSSELKPLQIQLQPGPYALDGFDVVADHLATMNHALKMRRNAAPLSVQTVDQLQLATTPARDMVDVLQEQGVRIWGCSAGTGAPGAWSSFRPESAVGSSNLGGMCLLRRGSVVQPKVYIDESPTICGLDEVEMYKPYELYLVEVYDAGREIHAYTHDFVERMARSPHNLIPIVLPF